MRSQHWAPSEGRGLQFPTSCYPAGVTVQLVHIGVVPIRQVPISATLYSISKTRSHDLIGKNQ